MIAQIRSSSAASSSIGTPGERGHDLGGQVVGGRPEPAAGDDQVDALAARNSQRGAQVVGPVADDHDVRQLDAAARAAARDSHGPFASRMIPDSTSVPVTTMPARTLTTSSPAAAASGSRRGRRPGRSS